MERPAYKARMKCIDPMTDRFIKDAIYDCLVDIVPYSKGSEYYMVIAFDQTGKRLPESFRHRWKEIE